MTSPSRDLDDRDPAVRAGRKAAPLGPRRGSVRISIGILAHNEEQRIAPTIRSLFRQSLFAPGRPEVRALEVICLANGCTDRTAAVARESFDRGRREAGCTDVSFRIEEIELGDRSNCWNVFVHEASDPAADFLIQMDADIDIVGEDALWNMVSALQESPEALVSSPRVMKHTAFASERSALDRLTLEASEAAQMGRRGTSGCLSCMRTRAARAMALPIGMMGTDNFLNHMLMSRGFTTRDFIKPFASAKDAIAVFRTYTRLKDILHHQRRRMIAATMNRLLFEHLYEVSAREDVGEYIRRRNREDRTWLGKYLHDQIRRRKGWIVSLRNLPNRFRWLDKARGGGWLKAAVLAVLASGVDVISAVRANLALRRRDRWLTRYW